MPASVPEGWRRVRLGEIADVIGGSTPPRGDPDCWNGSIPWVTPTEITRLTSRTVTETRECITEAGLKLAGLKLLPPGSVLLTTRATIGAVARVASPVTTNQGFQNLVPHEGTDSNWLYYIAQHSRDALQRLAGGSTFKEVSPQSIRRLEILLPPLPEQRAIAAVLDAVDDTIERTEAVIAATEDLRRGLLHELLTRGVPGMHSEWRDVPGLGTVPACWDVTTLGEVGTWMSGGTPSKDREEYWSGSIPWISAKDMKVREIWDATDRISEEAARSGSRIVPKGTILMVVRGMILAHSFPIAITRVPCAFNQDLKAVACREGILPDYLLAALDYRRRRLLDLPTTSTHGTLRVISEDLFSVAVPVPPVAEQQTVAAMLSSVDTKIASEQKRLTAALVAKGALASALLEGGVRVRADVAEVRGA